MSRFAQETNVKVARSPNIDLDVQDLPPIAIIISHREYRFRQSPNVVRRQLHATR